VLAVVVAVVAMIPTLHSAGWSLTALPRVDAKTPLGAAARSVDPQFHTVHPGAYDGQFYWGIAVDPLATGRVHRAFDKPSYRYGHPLYGWLGWLLGAGRARAAPAALAVAGLLALAVAAATAAALGVRRGSSGWEGLFVALNVGLIGAATHDLAEPVGAALLLGAFAARVWGRPWLAWFCLALLPLAKEQLILAAVAFVVWELVQRRGRAAALLATAAIPALVWWTYARVHLGAWFTSGDTALGAPLNGWRYALVHATVSSHGLLEGRGAARAAAVAVLLLLLVVLALSGLRALRLRGPVQLCYLALAAVAACLAPNATVVVTTALRNTSFLLVLVPFVSPRRGGA
jgi:hypothetical protein